MVTVLHAHKQENNDMTTLHQNATTHGSGDRPRHSSELFRSLSLRAVFAFGRGNCRCSYVQRELDGSSETTPHHGVSALHRDDVHVHEARNQNAN